MQTNEHTPLRNPYNYSIRILISLGIFCLTCTAAFAISGQEVISIVTAAFAGTIILIALVFYIKGVVDKKKIQKLFNGEGLLAHWEYPDNPLEEYARSEFKKEISRGRTILMGLPIAAAVLTYIEGETFDIYYGLISGLALGTVIFFIIYAQAKDSLSKSVQPPHQMFLSSRSVYIGGKFIDWKSWGFSFISASVNDFDPMGRQSIHIKYNVQTRYGSEDKDLYIPVPSGRRGEAEKLVSLLQG